LRLQAQHAQKDLAVLSRSNMMFLTLKTGFNEPTEPVWGNRYQYAPVIAEIQKKSGGKRNLLPNWNFFLGFGQRFLLNASQTEDGIHYFCVGFALSTTCQRERHAIAFLCLAPGAKEKLTALHKDPEKVKKLMTDVQRSPLRRYPLCSLIPGTIVPRVVGSLLDAPETTQHQFFAAVTHLFSPEGQLPSEYHFESKSQVLSLLLHH
jgi:hypothetical protein